MIAFLKGIVEHKAEGCVYLDVQGVGYAVAVPDRTLSQLPERGQKAALYTYLQVSENGIGLYGFLSLEEKALFERLIGVSGIGPKIAIAALSVFSPAELAEAITSENATQIARVPGVGKKTAQRIILELKGSLDLGLTLGVNASEAAAEATGEMNAAYQGAWEALLSMGFTSAEAELALKDAPEHESEGRLLQYALKRLGS